MKQLLYYVMLLSAIVGTGVIIAQVHLAGPSHNDHLKADRRDLTFMIARGRQLAITIDHLGPYGVVAVHKNAGLSASEMDSVVVKGWAVVFDNSGTKNTLRSVREVKNLLPMSADAIKFKADTLSIDGGFAGQYNAAIHITVPEASNISFMINGERVHIGTFVQDTVVRGHEVVGGQFRVSELMTLSNAMFGAVFKDAAPPLNPDALYITQGTDGAVSVPWARLSELAVHGGVPDYSITGEAKGQDWAFVDISIDESGVVTKASPKSFGNVDLAGIVARSLTQWRFHPFVYHDKPTRVISTVPVRLVGGRILLKSQ